MNNLLDFFRITGIVLGMLILVSCSKSNQEEGSWSHFMGLVDTVTVRDTIWVEKKIVFRDTVLIEKEVIKKVEVPAEIPEEYKRALEKFRAENSATTATDATIFSGMDSVNVRIFLNEDAKEIISEQRVRDKFELTLRGYDIPVFSLDSASFFTRLLGFDLWRPSLINFTMEVGHIKSGYGDNIRTYIYTTRLEFQEEVIFYRDEKPYRERVVLWKGGGYLGYAGKLVIEEALLEVTEEYAEKVANLYLSANPR